MALSKKERKALLRGNNEKAEAEHRLNELRTRFTPVRSSAKKESTDTAVPPVEETDYRLSLKTNFPGTVEN